MEKTKTKEKEAVTTVPIARLDTDEVHETMYRTLAGDYWLVGTGTKESRWGGRQGIQPLTASWAMAWIRQHQNEPGYTQLFDYGSTEQHSKQMISANLSYSTYQHLNSLAVMHDCTKTDIIEDLIRREWASAFPCAVYEPGYNRPLNDVVKDQTKDQAKDQTKDKPEKREKDYNLTVSGKQ